MSAGGRTAPGLDLGMQPVADLLLTPAHLNRPETLYPMQMHHCLECGVTQLGYIVNPSVVYKNFPFVSGNYPDRHQATTVTAAKARFNVRAQQKLLRGRYRL